jgi:two-component sensor histidine kinase
MIIRDVTPQKEAEEAVKCSLSQKELMFKELNHRVKNNLAMIASMMALQAESLFDSRDAVYYEKMQNRIRSIAMVYEWMYKSETGGMVDLNPFFMELVTTFHESVSLSAVSIDVSVLAEPVLVDNKTAVPLAMSVVELVTNALKYAFPVPTEESRIRVSLEIPEPGKGRLTVSDNGKGLPEDRESLMENSLGLKLIHALLRQIDGSVSVVSPPGTTFILEFSLPKRTA